MVESKCAMCGKKIVSKAARLYCDECNVIRKRECVKRCRKKSVERAKNAPPKPKKVDKAKETRETLALSARMAVATGLSYGMQVLLAQQENKDLRAFLEGIK